MALLIAQLKCLMWTPAPFVLRTDGQLSMFFKSESKSILLRVIQHIVQFEKGSANILMEKMKSLVRYNCLVCLLSHQLHLINS